MFNYAFMQYSSTCDRAVASHRVLRILMGLLYVLTLTQRNGKVCQLLLLLLVTCMPPCAACVIWNFKEMGLTRLVPYFYSYDVETLEKYRKIYGVEIPFSNTNLWR